MLNSSTQNILDVAPQGGTGVSGIAEGREVDTRAGSYTRDRVSPSSVGSETTQVSGCMTSEYQASPADSQVLDSRSECQPEVGPYENVDGALNTGKGVSESNLCSAISPSRTHGVRVANGAAESISNLADSQFQGTTIDELLALVASKLPDISLSEQHELEEIEAEREGGDTAASRYNDPASDRTFA